MKIIAVLAMVFWGAVSIAAEPIQITSKAEITKILSSIPVTDREMNYKNIGERLANVGMTANSIMVYKILLKGDIESDGDRIGDVIYQISTSNPSAVLTQNYCNMLGSPTYVKRGSKYIPQDRTANWLMTSKCQLP